MIQTQFIIEVKDVFNLKARLQGHVVLYHTLSVPLQLTRISFWVVQL